MTLTAISADNLPFRAAGAEKCAAARAANVVMQLPGLPGEFNVQFIGTGVATIPEATQEVFDVNNARKSVDIEWYQNKFVGRHWLLGEFKATLAENRVSGGRIEVVGESVFGANVINTNDFFFDFQFKRFPFLSMTNVTPIRNSAVISAVPPIGSVFKLDKPYDETFEFKSGPNRIVDPETATSRTIKFNQCDVVVFPEQNVGLNLIEQRKLENGNYTVTVEIENITEVEATFTYFTVIHYLGITTDNDYGFVLLKPKNKRKITYSVASTILNRTVDLPFFTALYQPTQLNGFRELELIFDF